MRLLNAMRDTMIERIMHKKFDSIDEEQSCRVLELVRDIVTESIVGSASENWNFTEEPLDVWKRLPESWFLESPGIAVSCVDDPRFSADVFGPAGRVYLSCYPNSIKMPAYIAQDLAYTRDLSYSTAQRVVRYTMLQKSIEQDKRDTLNLLTKVFRSHTTTTSLFQMYPELRAFILINEKRKKSLLPAPKPDPGLKELLKSLVPNA
jgi:hypothetical protein